jgi:hypothetical protein
MKKLISLVLLPLMFTSCFSTRLISDEPQLKKEFMNMNAQAVEFEMGEPDEVRETRYGYEYLYLYRPTKYSAGENPYNRFAFDENNRVIAIKSTMRHRARLFNPSATVAVILGPLLIVSSIIVASTAAE